MMFCFAKGWPPCMMNNLALDLELLRQLRPTKIMYPDFWLFSCMLNSHCHHSQTSVLTDSTNSINIWRTNTRLRIRKSQVHSQSCNFLPTSRSPSPIELDSYHFQDEAAQAPSKKQRLQSETGGEQHSVWWLQRGALPDLRRVAEGVYPGRAVI